jgi:hypothetical protein
VCEGIRGGGSAPGKIRLEFNISAGANRSPGIFRAQIEYRNAENRKLFSMEICFGTVV